MSASRVRRTIALVGHILDGKDYKTATPQTANKVIAFKGVEGDTTFIISKKAGDKLCLSTYLNKKLKGTYILDKHPKCNYYRGTVGSKKVKIQVSLKKIVGELRGWWV